MKNLGTIRIINPSNKLLDFIYKMKEREEKRSKEIKEKWENYFNKKKK